ncbi:alpha/beta hydrolase family esterase [Actinoplanes sp. NPDC049265]|uniref:alpha/beta hydrolase family esterase n=1 Tax=Actinoplanes sp. NPDC049265 TaxID=3363902 RepID=UPI00371E9504
MRDSVEVGGRTRTFTVVGGPPARDLILVFHGSKQTGDKHREFTGQIFDALAADGRTTVAYLDGYRGNWNDARRGSSFPARTEKVDDVGFVRAVVGKLRPERVFAVGYSNGGQMVMRLMHEVPDLLAGAAVIAATMPAPENFLLPGAEPKPMPVVLIHGTKDPIVSYQGGEMPWWMRKFFKVAGRMLSVPETAHYFATSNGITEPPTVTAGTTEYRQAGHPPVVLYTLHGAGHTVPGPKRAPAVLGRTNQDVNAAELVRRAWLE